MLRPQFKLDVSQTLFGVIWVSDGLQQSMYFTRLSRANRYATRIGRLPGVEILRMDTIIPRV